MSRESLCLLKVHAVPSSHVPSQHVRWDTCRDWNKWHTSNVLTLTLQSVCFSFTPILQWERCVYQCLMSGIELLQDLIHDGVGEIGNHRQLHFSEEAKGRKRLSKKSIINILLIKSRHFVASLTPKLCERPVQLFPWGQCGSQSEGWTHAQRQMRVEDLISRLQRKIKGRARGRVTPLSRQSPETDAS